jgi:hypothetical protein
MLLNKISVRWGQRILSPSAITFLILAKRQNMLQSFTHQPSLTQKLSPVKKDLFILS